METVDVIKQIVEGAEEPFVKLWPVPGEILLDENAGNESQLIVSIFAENAVIRVLNER